MVACVLWTTASLERKDLVGVGGQFFKLSHISVSLPKTSTLLQHDSKPKTVSFLLQDPSKIPSWLKINKIYYPDFIVPDPKVST